MSDFPENSQSSKESSASGDEILDVFRNIQKDLKPGGPPVDFEAIHYYIGEELDDDERSRVAANISTWQEWHEAYRDAMIALAAAKEVDPSDTES